LIGENHNDHKPKNK